MAGGGTEQLHSLIQEPFIHNSTLRRYLLDNVCRVIVNIWKNTFVSDLSCVQYVQYLILTFTFFLLEFVYILKWRASFNYLSHSKEFLGDYYGLMLGQSSVSIRENMAPRGWHIFVLICTYGMYINYTVLLVVLQIDMILWMCNIGNIC